MTEVHYESEQSGVSAPLKNGELADFSVGNHDFSELPRALNCSAAGTLVVDMGDLTSQAIRVIEGLNPYRVSRIYNAGSSAITVVGMW